MAKAKLVAAAAERKARRAKQMAGKTLVAVFTEKKKQKKKMMTTKNIVKEPEVKAAPMSEATTKAGEPTQLPAPPPPPPGESDYQKAYRMLKESRERLRGRGMPELDVEIDNFLKTINSWQHRQN